MFPSRVLLALLALALSTAAMAADVVFRDPFTLQLHVDKKHYYEEMIAKVPYVHENAIYLFKGDTFGVNLGLRDGAITGLTYLPKSEKADLTLEFRQEVAKDGTSMMLLKVTNNTTTRIEMNALMTVPGKKEVLKTTILPIEPGLVGYESWPHPIVQLVLLGLRTSR